MILYLLGLGSPTFPLPDGTWKQWTATYRTSQGSGAPYVEARGVQVRYGRQEVLRGVDLALWPGEIVVMMGRNGAGKTTLLRSLVGLLRPQAGSIRVNGKDIASREVADICQQVGYLPQDPNTLLFAESVREELLVTLRNHGISQSPNLQSSVSSLLSRLGLTDKADAYPRDLSVGEQRVALATITVMRGALLG
jgi:energy-coupling factor transport system ATP-binding protein